MAARSDHYSPADSHHRPAAGPSPTRRSRRHAPVQWQLVLAGVLVLGALLLLPLVVGYPQQEKDEPADAQARPAGQQPSTRPSQESPFVTRDKDGSLQWPRPRSQARQAERKRMVASQIALGGPFHDPVKDKRVLAALRAVPRHEFVPKGRRSQAYDDTPLPIGHGQTISQPYIVALMTERLQVKEGDNVLEIGTGSGYQAAVLNELTPYVYTIEILEPLCKPAVERFKQLGYKTIETKLADGYDGWKEHAPFDAIIVTCAAGHIPPPLWEQLKPGGRMVIPVGGVYETQRLLVLTKQKDGRRKSRNVLPVRFVPMTGKILRP